MAVTFKFKADGTGYTKGLNKMRGQTKQWSGDIGKMVVGAFAFGAVIGGLRSWTQSLNETARAAKLLGTTAQEMEKLNFIAQKGKVEFDDLKEFISNVNERVFEGAIQAGHMAAEWEALGIKAEELKDKTPIDVMSRLSDEFLESGDRASFAAAGIALFGDDFKRVINVIQMGSGEIKSLADEAATTSDGTRKSVERLSQAWIDFKNSAMVVLDFVVGGFKAVGKTIGGIVGFGLVQIKILFDYVANQGGVIGRIIKNLFTGNFEGIGDEIEKFKKNNSEIAFKTKANFEALPESILGVKEAEKEDTSLSDADMKKIKSTEKILDLQSKIAEMEKKAAYDALTLEEKRLALIRERAELEAKANDTTEEGLEAKKAILDINSKLIGVEKSIATEGERSTKKQKDLEDKAKKEAEDNARETQDLRDELASVKESNKIESMSDGDKLSYFKKKQQEALADAQAFEKMGATDEALRSRIKASELGGSIAGLEEGMTGEVNPSIIASSLASIGGGGGVSAFGNDPALAVQNKQLGILEKIENHLNPASGLDASRNLETPEL